MFCGDAIDITSFQVVEARPTRRFSLIADVNGERCFVKQHGNHATQCAADELKRLAGLPAVGYSRSHLAKYGPLLIARFHPHRGRLSDVQPDVSFCEPLSRILLYDVWVRNNDRTGTNILVLDSAELLPIDETAAFKRSATLRLSPRWRAELASYWTGRDPRRWALDQIQEPTEEFLWVTLQRAGVDRVDRLSDLLRVQWLRLGHLWPEFVTREVFGS